MSSASKIQVSAPKRRRIAELRLEGRSSQAIAEALGISRTAVNDVLARPDVQKAIEAERAARTESVRIALEIAGMQAVKSLAQAMTGAVDSRTAVAAADSVLDRIGVPRKAVTEQKHSGAAIVLNDPFAGRSDKECEFYAAHGHWPEETP